MSPPTPKRTGARRLALVAGAVLPLLFVSYAAFAAVSPAPSINAIGSGGYDSVTTDPAGFTQGQEVVVPNQYSLTIATGNQGAQGCNGTSGESAKIGLHSTNTSSVFEAQWATGAAANCPVNGPLTGVNFPNLANIPYNHHVWLHWQLVNKVKTIRILVCILNDRHHKPVPTPSPTIANPTASPSVSAANPTASVTPSVSQPTASATTASPTVNPQTASASPTETASAPAGTQQVNPVYGLEPGQHLPGFTVRCFIIKKQIKKSVVVFQAQDLDALTVNPLAGDLPGVQTVVVPVPQGTVYDHASWGATENTTNMSRCSGVAADGNTYPRNLAGPAVYTTGACQPANEQGYMTASVGAGPPQDPTVLATTELVSPSAGVQGSLVAPNNSLTATTPVSFPHSTDPAASTAGGHATLNLGNAPVG